jgi:hypothetical protein
MLLDSSMFPVATTFLFIFAIVFGLLTSMAEKIFKNQKVNAVIAAVFGIFSASYAPLVEALQKYIPFAAALLIVVFFVVFIKRTLGHHGGSADKLPMMITLALLLLLIGAFWSSISYMLPVGIDPTTALWSIGIIIILLILWGTYKLPK